MHLVSISVAVVFALVGLLVYALSANPKIAEVGRLMMFAGFLAIAVLAGRLLIP